MKNSFIYCLNGDQLIPSNDMESNHDFSGAYLFLKICSTLCMIAGVIIRFKDKQAQRAATEQKEKDRKAEKAEDREYRKQQELERREYYAQQRERERQTRAEEREQNRQHQLAMKAMSIHSPIQPAPIKSETLAEIGQQEIPSAEALRIVGDVIHSGERGIIFGATGQCKSVLAWQIGIYLALGKSCNLFPNIPTKHAPMPVYIFDGEMSKVNVASRYPKEFVPALQNVHWLPGAAIGYEHLIFQVKNIVNNTHTPECAIIIDNLMSICPMPTAKQICVLYDALKNIGEQADARGTKVTMLIVAHERKNKHYESLREIVIEDMYGSSYTGNFADFAIGIANTKDKDVKRIKVVKVRLEKDHENIIIARKETTPYLHLDYIKEVSEEEALTLEVNDLQPKYLRPGDITLEVAKQMRAMYKRGVKGFGLNAIGLKFGVSGTAVQNAFKRYNLL